MVSECSEGLMSVIYLVGKVARVQKSETSGQSDKTSKVTDHVKKTFAFEYVPENKEEHKGSDEFPTPNDNRHENDPGSIK
jgi:hypothetical protein